MLRTFIINVVRGLFLDVLSAAAAFGVLYLAFLLNKNGFTEAFSVYGLVALAAFISSVVIVVIFILAKVLNWSFVYGRVTINGSGYWKERVKNKKPVKAWKIRSVLLINLPFCAVAVVIFVFTREKLIEKFSAAAGDKGKIIAVLVMLSLLASTAFTQFIYFVSIRSHYKNAKCTGCKNIFCIVDVGIESESSSTTSYKFRNDGYGPYGYYEDSEGHRSYVGGKFNSSKTTTTKNLWLNCKCLVCGSETIRPETKKIKGNWIEGEKF